MSFFVNKHSWSKYSAEYSFNSEFDPNLIHLGLGLKGVTPRCVSNNKQGSYLDVGCGDGVNTNLLASYTTGRVIGIDIAKSAVEIADQRYTKSNLQFLNSSFSSFKPSGLKFDTITFFGSLDYIKIDSRFFQALSRLAANNAVCFISKFHPLWTTLFNNEIGDIKNDSYFTNGRRDKVVYGQENKYMFERYHYTVDYLLESFSKKSWLLDSLREPRPNIRDSAFKYTNYSQDPVLMERLLKYPMTMTLKFIYRGETE